MKRRLHFVLASLMLLLGACGDSLTGDNGGQPSLEALNQRFGFEPNTPMNVYFGCVISGSQLLYQMQLTTDGAFVIASQLDTGDIAYATGRYTYESDVITLRTDPNNFVFLDEQTTSITPQLGIVYQFETQVMRCVANGHEEDDPETRVGQYYICPEFSEGSASTQVNAFEFDISLPGSIFRDRNRNIRERGQPNILRGNGIYRRIGNQYVGYFGNQFDDYNVVTGTFEDGNAIVQINELPDGYDHCNYR